MKINNIKIRAAAFVLFAVIIPLSIHAEELPPLTEAREQALQEFATTLLDPITVVITASLGPPYTYYGADIPREELDRLVEKAVPLLKVGLDARSRVTPEDTVFKGELSCGWGKKNERSLYAWYHDESVCPHEDGTSHEGTVTAQGTYDIWVQDINKDVKYLTTRYYFDCTYSGSESGRNNCVVEQENFGGRFGEMKSGPKVPVGTAAAIAGIVVVAGVTAYLLRRMFKK